MLRLYRCNITDGNADTLIAALTANGRAASLEATAAIRWGIKWNLAVDELEPDLRDALLDALDDSAPAFAPLRAALEQSATTAPRRHRFAHRVHNPKRRHCECLSDCWCKRTSWGRALRWYIPVRYHSSVSACVAPQSEVAS